jgi:glycosyltransferase involved in cell wall biosynthesis
VALDSDLVARRVSLVVPCYNVEKYFDQFLQSILVQTYKNLEVILVNDGANDATTRMLRDAVAPLEGQGYAVKLIEQANKGLGGAVDTGLKHFTGEFLMWPDPDDWLAETSVERRVELMRANPDIGLLRTNAHLFVDASGKQVGHWMPLEGRTTRPTGLFEDFLFMRYFFAPVCHMVRSAFFLEVHPSRSIYFTPVSSQNFQLLVPLVEAFPVLQSPEPLAYYRVREDSRSRVAKSHKSLMQRFDQLFDLSEHTVTRLRTYSPEAHVVLRNFHFRQRMLPTSFRGAMKERSARLIWESSLSPARKRLALSLLALRCNPAFYMLDAATGRVASRALARSFDRVVRMRDDEMRWGAEPTWATA